MEKRSVAIPAVRRRGRPILTSGLRRLAFQLMALAALAAPYAVIIATAAPPVVWVEISKPMEKRTWTVVEDIDLVGEECKSDHVLPRVCLYRHIDRCRIIVAKTPELYPQRVRDELARMCDGWFPEPVLLRRRFNDPSYFPNQAPPSADPAWLAQQER